MPNLPFPRRVTLEHEAAHAIVAKAGGGTVDFIDLTVTDTGSSISLGRAGWKPQLRDANTLHAGYAAGPAQHAIACKRLGVDEVWAQLAVEQEGRGMAALLPGNDREKNQAACIGLIQKHLPAMTDYLNRPTVQAAVQAVADYLAEHEGRVEWDLLAEVIDWDELPALPVLV